jgi:hypothetical protein
MDESDPLDDDGSAPPLAPPAPHAEEVEEDERAPSLRVLEYTVTGMAGFRLEGF